MTDERSRFDRSPRSRHIPADQATVRRSNLGLVLRHLRDNGPRSRARVFGPDLAGARIVLSTLGFTAAVRGGAHVALESVFDDPTVVPLSSGGGSADPSTRTESTA